MKNSSRVAIVGGGLSGAECASQLVRLGVTVTLFEMRPIRFTEAHRTEYLSELVCSNSLKSNDRSSPQGLLKEEMRLLNSIVIEAADNTSIPAGESLSVDRLLFSKYITDKILSYPALTLIRREIGSIDEILGDYDAVVIATGPLTTPELLDSLKRYISDKGLLYFYDAISPIITFDSIDMNYAFFGSRYKKGSDDYINCPLTKEEYDALYNEIINAELYTPHIDEDLRFFEGCLPVEEIAKRGYKSLSFGPFKPVGLGYDKNNMPYAVVQLRRENKAGTLYSVVAFQTRMKYGAQERVLKKIPALRNCEIVRFGQMHRNIYLNSPLVLQKTLSLKGNERVFIAGTLTGVEGYVEAAASGIMVAHSVRAYLDRREFEPPPDMTAMGLLYRYITGEIKIGREFNPSNINKGLFLHNKERRYSERLAHNALKLFMDYASTIKKYYL